MTAVPSGVRINRAILVQLRRLSGSPASLRQVDRLRHKTASRELFAAYLRRVAVRGRGPQTRPVLEAALRRYHLLNPHLYGRGRA